MKSSTYNQLLIFHVIAQEGHISAAAKKLEMAVPSVSQALKLFEKELGLPLFSRTTRTIELTDAGQKLKHTTQHLLSELDLALESIKDLSHEPSGKVKITVPRFVYQYLIEPIYAEFCQKYPTIQLEISVSDEAFDIIKEGFDMGIRFGHRVSAEMVARQLTAPMKEALFASPDYIHKYGYPKTPTDLNNHQLIQYRFISSKQIAPLVLNDRGTILTIDMPISLIVNDTDLMINAAIKGLGIGKIIKPAVDSFLKSGILIPVLEDYWTTYSGLFAYFPKNAVKAKRLRVFVDFLVEKSKEHQLLL